MFYDSLSYITLTNNGLLIYANSLSLDIQVHSATVRTPRAALWRQYERAWRFHWSGDCHLTDMRYATGWVSGLARAIDIGLLLTSGAV